MLFKLLENVPDSATRCNIVLACVCFTSVKYLMKWKNSCQIRVICFAGQTISNQFRRARFILQSVNFRAQFSRFTSTKYVQVFSIFRFNNTKKKQILISMPNENCPIYHWHYPNNTFFFSLFLLSHDGIPSFTFVVC